MALAVVFLVACTSDDDKLNIISGRISDAITGSPIANASVSTDPATGEVKTNTEGKYTLKNSLIELGKVYRVNASRDGYTSNNVTVTVQDGTSNIADIELRVESIGVNVSTKSLRFAKNENEKTLLLSSTTTNNTFSIQSDSSWLSVTPETGDINNIDQRILKVNVDRTGLEKGNHSGQLVINSNTNSIIVSVVVAVDVALPTSTSPDNPGTSPTEGSDTSRPLGTLTREEFKIILNECHFEGTDLDCGLTITREGNPTTLWLECGYFGSRLIDESGGEYPTNKARLGNDVEESDYCGRAKAEFSTSGLTVSGGIKFKNVPKDISEPQLIEINFIYGKDTFTGTKFATQFTEITIP